MHTAFFTGCAAGRQKAEKLLKNKEKSLDKGGRILYIN